MRKRQLIQMGYVAPAIEPALDYWTRIAGGGPFFVVDYEPEQQVFLGKPTHIRFRLAYGYLGDMQIEVVEQLNDGASAYREALEQASEVPMGGVLHHVMLLHEGYDAACQSYLDAGATRSYEASVPGAGRFCYLDARSLMGCHVELVEETALFEQACQQMREIHRDWDGSRPRRDFMEIMEQLQASGG